MRLGFSQRGRRQDTRYELVKAVVPAAQSELYTSLLSLSLAERPFAQPVPPAIRNEIRRSDPEFVAGLALYFREQAGRDFRDLAFFLTAELAALNGNDESIAALIGRIIGRPEDVPLWLDYYFRSTKQDQRPGRAVRRALGALLNQMDEYQYSRSGTATQKALGEALGLLKPKAGDRSRKALFSKISKGHAPVRMTWEQEWFAVYQQRYDSAEQRQVALREKWKEGISTFRIGYTPLLGNLGPMLCAGVSGKVLKLAAEYLGNAAAVKRSGVSPLRLLEVWRTLRRMDHGGGGMLSEALEKAALYSSWTRCRFGSPGVSVIAMDVSNSMKRTVNGYTGVHRFDVAPLLAMLLKDRGDRVITGIIGNTWRPVELPVRPLLLGTEEFRAHEGEAGYGINAWLVLRDLLWKKQAVARVLVFTDCRLWDSRAYHQPAGADIRYWWRLYRQQVAPEAKLFLFDLAGYGSKQLECPEDDVLLIAGWKDTVFDVLSTLETAH
ncbi:MAG TPA: hypothetical protein VHE54_07280 [Puia sp.]|nr:hypothetical protein [Puia sp.]